MHGSCVIGTPENCRMALIRLHLGLLGNFFSFGRSRDRQQFGAQLGRRALELVGGVAASPTAHAAHNSTFACKVVGDDPKLVGLGELKTTPLHVRPLSSRKSLSLREALQIDARKRPPMEAYSAWEYRDE